MATAASSNDMERKVTLCCVWLVEPGERVFRAKFEKALSPCTFSVGIEAAELVQLSGPSSCELVVGERIVREAGDSGNSL